MKRVGDLNYVLKAPNLKSEFVHYNRLYRYNVRSPPALVLNAPSSNVQVSNAQSSNAQALVNKSSVSYPEVLIPDQ